MAVSGKRKVKIEIGADAGGMDKGIGDAKRKLRTMKREQEKAAKDAERAKKKQKQDREKAAASAGSSVAGFGKTLLHGMTAAAGFDLAGGMAGLFSDVFDTERELTRFGIDAQLSGEKLNQFRDQLMKTSEATGVSRESLVKGAHAYQILTGDADGAVKASALFADVANATGASMDDIAANAAALHNMKIAPDDMRKAFDILVYQGHAGAIELRDLAGQMSSLAPMFSSFSGGSSVKGLAELGAAAQVIRKGFGSAEEMATGFRGAMSQLLSPAVQKKLKAAGANILQVDPKTKKATLKDWNEVIGEIKNSKVGDDPIGLRKIFTNIRGFRAIQMAVENYDEMAKLSSSAADSDQVNKDAHTWMESSSGRIAKAWEHIKNSVAEALTPDRIDRFASALTKAADAFSIAVNGVSQVIGMFEGAPDDKQKLDAENELFINPTLVDQSLSEKDAIARAQGILSAKSVDDLPSTVADDPFGAGKMQMRAYASSYGFDNLQGAAIRYLKSEGIDYKNTVGNAWDSAQRAGTAAIDEDRFARAVADALRKVGIGKVTIPNSTVASASSNAIKHITGNHR